MSNSSVRQVVCTKWGSKFGGADVNRLYRMVRANVAGELRFVCVADNFDGLDAGIETIPLPDVPVVGDRNNRGWRKLALFADIPELRGPTLYLDLDVVIVDSIDDLFELDGEFRVIKDYKPVRYRHSYTGNTSCFRFNAGAHTDLLDDIARRGIAIVDDFRNEQEFMSYYMRERGLLQYWPRAWCVSYKHDCVHLMPRGLFQPPFKPDGAKIIVFHGTPKPDEAIEGAGSKWYRVVKGAPWLQRYMDVGL